MRRVVIVLFLAAWLVLAAAATSGATGNGKGQAQADSRVPLEDFTGKVVGVADGDTISVMHGGKAERIRLYGIDCPEKAQAFGTKTKQFTAALVFGQDVTIKPKSRDRYGRTVGEVLLADGRNVNQELVKAGLAWWYERYAANDTTLQELEAAARAAKAGLWADLGTAAPPVPPWVWRAKRR
jgi:endonuclease YncB( thermonuclease family)